MLNLYRYLIVSCKDFERWLPGEYKSRRVQRSTNREQPLVMSRTDRKGMVRKGKEENKQTTCTFFHHKYYLNEE